MREHVAGVHRATILPRRANCWQFTHKNFVGDEVTSLIIFYKFESPYVVSYTGKVEFTAAWEFFKQRRRARQRGIGKTLRT